MSLLVWINKERAEGHSKILKFFIIFFKIFFSKIFPVYYYIYYHKCPNSNRACTILDCVFQKGTKIWLFKIVTQLLYFKGKKLTKIGEVNKSTLYETEKNIINKKQISWISNWTLTLFFLIKYSFTKITTQ